MRAQRVLPAALGASAIVAVVVCALVAMPRVPMGVPGQWVWERQPLAPLPATFGVVASALAGLGAVCLTLRVARTAPLSRWRIGACLGLLVVTSMAFSIALLGMEPDPAAVLEGGSLDRLWTRPPFRRAMASLLTDVRNDVAFGYFGQSLRVESPVSYLRGYADLIGTGAAPQRVRTHPPGPVLFFWAVRRALIATGLLDAPGAWVFGRAEFATAVADVNRMRGPQLGTLDATAAMVGGLALLAVGACTVIPLYLLTRLVANPGVALSTAGLAAFIPSLILFVPGIDQSVTFLGVTAVWLFVLGCRRPSLALCAGSGVVLFLAGMVTIGAPVLLGAMGLYAVGGVALRWRDRARRTAAARHATAALGAAAAGLGLPFLVLKLACGYEPIAVAHTAKAVQAAIMRDWHRGYATWLGMNLVDFAVFAGPCLVGIAGSWLILRLRRARRERRLGRADLLAMAVLATLLLIDLSGTARGEVGRIWCLLMPYFAIPAALQCVGPAHGHRNLCIVVVVALAMAQCVTMQSNLDLVKPSW